MKLMRCCDPLNICCENLVKADEDAVEVSCFRCTHLMAANESRIIRERLINAVEILSAMKEAGEISPREHKTLGEWLEITGLARLKHHKYSNDTKIKLGKFKSLLKDLY
ncbi:hypothetical protein DRJ17_05110 [Candidatus Woesearchaeota archaeon]|nr:MAG: hypothetical protein DRJ17_05110 [Candidatus Woesearchaeota archaeon]